MPARVMRRLAQSVPALVSARVSALVPALAFVCVGCGGSAGLVLQAPVQDQCAQAGLHGCPELTRGVLLYLDGKETEAVEYLRAGLAQNAPEDVKRYALLVRTLGSVPGASSYAQPLLDIASLLDANAEAHGLSITVTGPSSAALPSSGDPRPATAPSESAYSAGTMTADTDPARVRDGVAAVPEQSAAWCTALAGKGATCRQLVRGPLHVTDVISTQGECIGQSVAVLRNSELRLHLRDTSTLRGTRIALRANDILVLVQAAPAKTPPSALPATSAATKPPATGAATKPPATSEAVQLDEVDERYACGIYWSGFVPYGLETTPSPEARAFWERSP